MRSTVDGYGVRPGELEMVMRTRTVFRGGYKRSDQDGGDGRRRRRRGAISSDRAAAEER